MGESKDSPIICKVDMEFEIKYRVKNMEAFKDGNVLGGRFLKPNEILILSEADKNKIEQSGGVLEVLETVIPNPKKITVEVVEEVKAEEQVEAPQPAKKRAGRPRKNA